MLYEEIGGQWPSQYFIQNRRHFLCIVFFFYLANNTISLVVAGRVLEKGPRFQLLGHEVNVERPPKPDPRSILVLNIPHNISTEMLEMFFESKKKSGGGDIAEIQYEEGYGEARVSFQDIAGRIYL